VILPTIADEGFAGVTVLRDPADLDAAEVVR
jgi:hypothetical protein